MVHFCSHFAELSNKIHFWCNIMVTFSVVHHTSADRSRRIFCLQIAFGRNCARRMHFRVDVENRARRRRGKRALQSAQAPRSSLETYSFRHFRTSAPIAYASNPFAPTASRFTMRSLFTYRPSASTCFHVAPPSSVW
jgi:hypothetical protein